MIELGQLTPEAHACHALHRGETDWLETNCYVDLWVELLTALQFEPLACLGFTLTSDFEGDQWTFFKPRHGDLRTLYGLEVEEISLWRSVLEHCRLHLEQGRIPLIEADSFFLPDTRATEYRQHHVKTTIAPTYIDRQARELRYFHNAGFFSLSGVDFEGLFRFDGRDALPDDVSGGRARWLPPFCEIVKLERAVRRDERELRALSLGLSREHFAWRPETNPFERFARSWPGQLELLLAEEPETYHGYTFSMLRQCGANYYMLAAYLRWQFDGAAQDAEVLQAADAFQAISQTCKAMLMKLARVIYAKKPRDFSEQLGDMARRWEHGMNLLHPVFTR